MADNKLLPIVCVPDHRGPQGVNQETSRSRKRLNEADEKKWGTCWRRQKKRGLSPAWWISFVVFLIHPTLHRDTRLQLFHAGASHPSMGREKYLMSLLASEVKYFQKEVGALLNKVSQHTRHQQDHWLL